MPSISAQKQHKRVDWELPRKLYHSVHGVLVLVLYYCLPHWQALDFLPFLLPPFLLYFYLDHLRIVNPKVNQQFLKIAGMTMRPAERLGLRLTSSSAYMAGILVSLTVFEKRVAVMACLFLAFVDTAAAFGGRAAGLWWPRGNLRVGFNLTIWPRFGLVKSAKSIGGFMAAFVTASLIYGSMCGTSSVPNIVLAGCIGGVSEGFTIDGVDDDLSLPLLTGTLLTLFKTVLF